MPNQFTVGQKLWYVPNDTRWDNPREFMIKAIGRKWLTVTCDSSYNSDRRVSIETLKMDGGGMSSPGQCYLSQADHEGKIALDNAWRELVKCIDKTYGKPPAGVTVDAIRQAQALLFGEVSDGR